MGSCHSTGTELEPKKKKVKGDAAAAAVVQALLETFLPDICAKLGNEAGEGNEQGLMICESPPYHLQLKESGKDVRRSDLIEELQVDIEEVEIHPALEKKLTSRQKAFPVLVIDASADIHVKIGKAGLGIRLVGEGFWPDATVELDWLKLKAKVQLAWAIRDNTLSISFLEKPTVKWDIELKVCFLDLPDFLEDTLPARALSSQLALRDTTNPIVVSLSDEEGANQGQSAAAASSVMGLL